MRLTSKARFGLMFVTHQVIVLWVTITSAGVLAASIFNVLQLFGWLHARAAYNWLFNGNPYFPAQAALALLLGWLVGRNLRDPSMIWVWALPTLLLGYALFEIPTAIPHLVSPAFQAGVGQSRWVHYFGWGCHLGSYCLDQSSFTRPFYAGVSYSLGALAAMKTLKLPHHDAKRPFWSPLLVGLLFLVCAIYDTINSVRAAGWHWQYFPFEGDTCSDGTVSDPDGTERSEVSRRQWRSRRARLWRRRVAVLARLEEDFSFPGRERGFYLAGSCS